MTTYRSGFHSEIIREWWQALTEKRSAETTAENAPRRFVFDRGPRARLRRSTGLNDVAQEPAVWTLVERLKLPDSEDSAVLLVAAVLAHVKEDAKDGRSLAYLLGVGPAGKGEASKLSELRFQRLMRAELPDDFVQQLRRALAIGGHRADVAVLANDLLAWSRERRFLDRTSSGMKFRWARDFYLKRGDGALLAGADATAPAAETADSQAI
jgi:CRISPR system Cascade subunit CasB